MVSHIDADHIDGILDLTDELLEARDDAREPLVRIDRAWHNSFSDMITKTGIESATDNIASSASLASAFGDLGTPNFDPHESRLILSSVSQGRRLRRDFSVLNIDLNKLFEDKIVLQGGAKKPWRRGELKLTVIGPTKAEIEKLKQEWAKQLKKILAKEGAASVAAAESLDTSVSNLASIVAIAEVGNKSVLLTGDARGDMILNWLEQTGKLASGGTIHFDILKLPHHGSNRNVSPEFFERITADHYVMCGNGGHGNPEPDTFKMLFDARPKLNYKIYMTYGPDELKKNKKYIKVKNHKKLEKVLKPAGRLELLRFPEDGENFIDIEL